MRSRTGVVAVLGIVLVMTGLTLGAAGAATASATGAAPTVLRLRSDGVVDPFVADYLVRGIADAAAAHDAAVLIEIDTPGGLDSSMRQVTQAILNAKVPVIGYVAPSGARAASAGAFVLMSAPIAAMAPGTNVGAATPVGLSGATESQKAVNDAAAYMRTLAQDNGRNGAVAATFVTDAASLSSQQALNDHVIDLVAPSETQLLSNVDGRVVTLGDGTAVTMHTSGATIEDRDLGGLIGFLHRLLDPSLAFIFFWLGLALIVVELLFPGHIVSGTLGAILVILAFVTFGLLPVRLVGVALLVASAVALIVEARHPGLGIWGALGLVFLVLGGWLLYDRSGGGGVSPWVIAPVAAAVGLFFGVVVVKARKLRDLPPPAGPERIVGREGVALGSGLDPKGVVRVDAEEWRAVSAGGRVPAGSRVKVTGIDGLVLTVEPSVQTGATAGRAPAAPQRGEGEAGR
jgi:membrane-bound serine protease (ClpP class)